MHYARQITGIGTFRCALMGLVMEGSEFGDKHRRALFGANAAEYGDGRPGYPSAVFDYLQLSWWNHFGDPDRNDPFRDAVQPLLEQYAPQFAESAGDGGAGIGAHPYALDVAERSKEINTNGKFGPVDHVLIPWTTNQTADEMQRFLGSFSHWMALETTQRMDLLRAVGGLVDTEFGGAVDRPFLTAISTARRLCDPSATDSPKSIASTPDAPGS